MEVSCNLKHLESLVSPVLYHLTTWQHSVILPGAEHVCQSVPSPYFVQERHVCQSPCANNKQPSLAELL